MKKKWKKYARLARRRSEGERKMRGKRENNEDVLQAVGREGEVKQRK